MTVVKMPQLGETVIEGTILKWLKQEGDQVALDEPLFEISTDKVDTEVPSSAAGVLAKIMVPEGETVAVGTELAEISEGGAGGCRSSGGCGAARFGWLRKPRPRPQPPVAPMPPPLRHHPRLRHPPLRRCRRRWRLRRRRSRRRLGIGGLGSQILSPLVRKLATEHGVDLAQVSGTGTGGRITKNDVLGFVASRGAGAPASAGATAPAPAAQPAPASAPAPCRGGAGRRGGRRGDRAGLAHPQADRAAHEGVARDLGTRLERRRGQHGERRPPARTHQGRLQGARGLRPDVHAVRDASGQPRPCSPTRWSTASSAARRSRSSTS